MSAPRTPVHFLENAQVGFDLTDLVFDVVQMLAALDAAIHGEMDRVSQQLTSRVKELAERYEKTRNEANTLVEQAFA